MSAVQLHIMLWVLVLVLHQLLCTKHLYIRCVGCLTHAKLINILLFVEALARSPFRSLDRKLMLNKSVALWTF